LYDFELISIQTITIADYKVNKTSQEVGCKQRVSVGNRLRWQTDNSDSCRYPNARKHARTRTL